MLKRLGFDIDLGLCNQQEQKIDFLGTEVVNCSVGRVET